MVITQLLNGRLNSIYFKAVLERVDRISHLKFRIFFPYFEIIVYIFVYFWLCCVFGAVHCTGFLKLQQGGLLSRCMHDSNCGGFSLWSTGSRHSGFSSYGTWALALCLAGSIWDLHGPEIEPRSPVLADGFLTTGPPGTFHYVFII